MGVSYDKARKAWCSSYGRNRYLKYFETEELAKKDYDHIERMSLEKSHSFHNFSGFENKFVKVICLTGERNNQKSLTYLAKNKTDHKYRIISAQELHKRSDVAGAPSTYRYPSKGYRKIRKDGKTFYQPILKIKGKTYFFDVFETAKEARKEYEREKDNYYFCPEKDVKKYRTQLTKKWRELARTRIAENVRNRKRLRNFGYKNVYNNCHGYLSAVRYKGKTYRKWSKDLSTVLNWRNCFFREHNLPVPNDRKENKK